MTLRLSTCALLGALCCSLLLNALQWVSGDGADRPPAAPAPDIAALELTPAQRTALEEDCANCCSERSVLREDLAALRQELSTALTRASLDPERSRRLAAEIGELQARCLLNSVETVLRVRAVLNDEQIATLLRSCGGPADLLREQE